MIGHRTATLEWIRNSRLAKATRPTISQSTRPWIIEKIKSFRESDVLPFHNIHDARMVKAASAKENLVFKKSIDTLFITICEFIAQILDPDPSCRAEAARLIVRLSSNSRRSCAPETGTYCEARKRIPVNVIKELVRQSSSKIDADGAAHRIWKGRRVVIIDGSTVSMPDTHDNQRVYPQSKTPRYRPRLSIGTDCCFDIIINKSCSRFGELALQR